MLNVAICDDNALHLKHACALIARELVSYVPEIEGFGSAEELLNCVSIGDYAPDIAVLDIDLNGESGIDLAKKLNAAVPGCQIIFLTGYIDYAPDVYDAEHVWFVLKEAAESRIGPALQKALDASARQRAPAVGIMAKSQGKAVLIPLRDILYIDRVGRKSRIVTTSENYIVTKTPDKLIPPDIADVFIHCHQGYWVSIGKISALERNEFVLHDGTRIPISRTQREQARTRFFEMYRLL